MEETVDAVVVGAGITGLTCAYSLQKRFNKIVVIEKNRVGGLIKTNTVSGFQCETGPSIFVNKKGILNFLQEIGLGDDAVYPSIKRSGKYIWCKDKVCRVPTNPVAFLMSPLFPDTDKLMLFRLVQALLRRGFLRPQAEDESVAEFCARIFGSRTIDRLLDPVLKGIYGGDVKRLSARSLFSGVWQVVSAGGSLIDYFKQKEARGGMFVLRSGAEAIVQKLLDKIKPNSIIKSSVTKISALENVYEYQVELENGDSYHAKHIFIATSGQASAKIVESLDASLANELAQLAYTALLVANCSVPKNDNIIKGAFGVLFPREMPSSILGVMFNSELFPYKAPSGQHLLTVCLGGVGKQQYIKDVEEAEFRDMLLFELKNKLGLKQPQILCTTRHLNAIPQYEIGHYKLVSKMQEFEKRYQGIYFIGADIGGIAVPDRIGQALERVHGLLG